MKECLNCHIEKELSEFPKRKDSKDGRINYCKNCKKDKISKWLEENKDSILKRKVEFRNNDVRILKKCTGCLEEKELSLFGLSSIAKDGLKYKCKECRSNSQKTYLNSEAGQIAGKKYRSNNKELIVSRRVSYYNKNRDDIIRKTTNYSKNNQEWQKEYINKYMRNRMKIDPLFKLQSVLRSRINNAFKSSTWDKNTKTHLTLGCDYLTAFKHLERKFTIGMNWENQGEWHIDHVIPLSSATTKEELIKLCHYTNLQPLWAFDNLSKGNKIHNTQVVLTL